MNTTKFDTAWTSYEFHQSILDNLQDKNNEVIVKYNNFLNQTSHVEPPPRKEVVKLRREMNQSYDELIVAYEKCLSSIRDLISINNLEPLSVPDDMRVSNECLEEYKSITHSHYELAKMEQEEINEVLS
tara:strand:+ start:632 stop:1018 length:387 start_codon:yes stop_codon:yes gene_type:complete